jgi:hypothetical protein
MGRIRTKPDRKDDKIEIGGWLDGKGTYLWLGKDGKCIGTISDKKLYRLAKAIVKQFEGV